MSLPHIPANDYPQYLNSSSLVGQSASSVAEASTIKFKLTGNNYTTTPTSQPNSTCSLIENKSPQDSSKTQSEKSTLQSKIINRKLKGYLFEDSIREFNPEKLYKAKESRKRESYKVHGVNILNRDDLDSKTAIERLQKRRAQHNRVERRRRDMINNAIEELSEIIPNAQQDKFARSNVLRLAIDYIRDLQTEAHNLRSENESLKNTRSVVPRLDPSKKPPTIFINSTSNQNMLRLQSDITPSLPPSRDQKLQSSSTLPYESIGNSSHQIYMTSPTGYSTPFSSASDKPRLLSLPTPAQQTHSSGSMSIATHGIEGNSWHTRSPHHHTRHMSIPNVSTPLLGLAPPPLSHQGHHSAPTSPLDCPQRNRHGFFFQQ